PPVDKQQDLLLFANMNNPRSDVLSGTLDLLVLKTLEQLGAQHGFGIARRIEQLSTHVLVLNQGTLYPALLRLQQQGLIRSEWGTSANNRKARFYELTKKGRTRLAEELAAWQLVSGAVNHVVGAAPAAARG
ncbi:MAG TPA: PadR family transcriptional regulator, partial [Opitutaceae bacterium]|nr:PadR family transcriptional regulator [Opitutaceae bacterium]